MSRESDTPIVLRGKESLLQGEGVYGNTEHAKEKRCAAGESRASKQQPTKEGRRKQLLQTSLRGMARAARRCKERRFLSS